MLFCACLGKLIVPFSTVPGSQECLDYHVVQCCAKTPIFFLKEKKYCEFCQKGHVLSPNLGQVLKVTLFMIPCRITYKQPLQMIMEPTGGQGSPR